MKTTSDRFNTGSCPGGKSRARESARPEAQIRNLQSLGTTCEHHRRHYVTSRRLGSSRWGGRWARDKTLPFLRLLSVQKSMSVQAVLFRGDPRYPQRPTEFRRASQPPAEPPAARLIHHAARTARLACRSSGHTKRTSMLFSRAVSPKASRPRDGRAARELVPHHGEGIRCLYCRRP